MRVMWALMATAGAWPLGGCATLARTQEQNVAIFCGHASDRDPRPWTHIAAPADADAFRKIAAAHDYFGAAPRDGREYWFSLPDGTAKYCITNLQQRCGKEGAWWIFEPTADGRPGQPKADAWACLP